MTTDDVMLLVVDALDRARIPAMLAGSFSSNYYGIPRSTEDVDFVIRQDAIFPGDLERELGPQFELNPQSAFELTTGTQKLQFLVKGTGFMVELFRLSDDPFDQQRFERRIPVEIAGRKIFLPTAEDVIVMKLRWKREKDKEDVHDVMSVQRGKLDWSYIEAWCARHGTLDLMKQIRDAIPEI